MLDINELLELCETISEELNEHLEEIFSRLNRTEQLPEFLKLLGMEYLIGIEPENDISKNGKIVVIGQCEINKDKLQAIGQNLGIDKNRFEFYLNYEDAKTYDFRKMQWSPNYSMVLVGQMPHSGTSKGDYSSIISAIECQEGYPPVVRIGTSGLKITKTSFRHTLEHLLLERKIA